ncbi:MAG TPA: glycosyltransferase family 4 protein [Solirubrobacterales bacterium]|nr:glycosyltransferase family 4 protein [Solirubrobacterales bacterium]
MSGVRLAVSSRAEMIGGAEHTLGTLLRNLDERFSVSLVTASAEVADFLAAHRRPRRVTIVPRRGDQDPRATIPRLRAAFAKDAPHLVHVNRTWLWDRPVDILAATMVRGARVVVVEHTQSLPTRSGRQRQFRRRLSERIDAIVSVSDAAAREAERHVGLPTGTVRTIHNGVEPAEALPAGRPLGRPVTIGAVGRLSWEKGYEYVPPILRELGGEARALIVGDGPDREKLARLALAEGVAERFEMVGWQHDVSDWFPRFDVLLAPSRSEGSPPLAALQAMMVGVPVVATAVGGIPEAVDDHETGLLVPPADTEAMAAAIDELIVDDGLRRRIAAAARARVERDFAAPTMARRFEALYAEISPAARGFSAAPAPAA